MQILAAAIELLMLAVVMVGITIAGMVMTIVITLIWFVGRVTECLIAAGRRERGGNDGEF